LPGCQEIVGTYLLYLHQKQLCSVIFTKQVRCAKPHIKMWHMSIRIFVMWTEKKFTL
jgi:hypothetical protein